ncbi:hypothetical protein [Nocardia sp. XZ_19_231]|uniref:hypothetical protein n=1 Tax=Nocardia sp. XZ_19_231 TaxID=2769252 RepID=UPI0018906351|nr:hypothetical protein [Nocardia sp. XZ_19_231]
MIPPEDITTEATRGTRMAEAYPDVLALVAEAVAGGVHVGMFTPEQVRALLLEGMRERRAGIKQTDQGG